MRNRAVIALLVLLAAASPSVAQKASAPAAQRSAYAIVAGSVFRESGFSLPGATVTLAPKGVTKSKNLKSVTDARGEFAFRVPAAPANYLLTAAMKGFKTAEAEAAVGGEERVDVTLVLSPESQ